MGVCGTGIQKGNELMDKRILMISDNMIFGFGGGSLEEHKYYDGLRYYANTHHDELKVLSIDTQFEDTFSQPIKKTRMIDMIARVCGHSSYMFVAWLQYRSDVLAYQPDLIVLGRSRMGFIAKDIRKYLPECKIVCNMENVELDYVDGYFANKQIFLKFLYVQWEKMCVKRDEAHAIQYSHALDYLTNRDYNRAHELYFVREKQEMILPICIEKATTLIKESEHKTVVFIGSLNYGSNVNALMEFIKNVWTPYFSGSKEISFVIGGCNPNERLKQMVKEIPNCFIYENFTYLNDIVPKGAMVIAPIQKGAGMKVKVAETLSMGLLIAASDEALVGYEKALEGDQLNSIIRCNTSEEYMNAILLYCDKTEEELEKISEQNKKLYQELYSYEVSRKAIANLCDHMLIGD